MPGIKALRRIQLGQEAAAGTAVAATAAWRGTGMLKDDRKVVFPEETIGYLPGLDRSYTSFLGGSIALEGEATFEQLPYILNSSIHTAAPTTDTGTGTGYIRSWTPATVSALATSDFTTLTIEGGDNTAAEEMEFSFCPEWELSGKAGEAWSIKSTFEGRQVSTTTFTASTDITISDVEEMLFSKSKLYIDPTSDTPGTTVKAKTLLDCSIKATSMLQSYDAADGANYFSDIKQAKPEIVVSLTFEHDGTATAEKVFWRSQTARVIKILCEGSALAGAGAYTYKTFAATFAGKWETFDKIDEMDGNDVIKATFRTRYNSTAALWASFVVVNEVATLP